LRQLACQSWHYEDMKNSEFTKKRYIKCCYKLQTTIEFGVVQELMVRMSQHRKARGTAEAHSNMLKNVWQ
jgi:hypothetical protein